MGVSLTNSRRITIKSMQWLERVNTKMYRQRMSILLNQISSTETDINTRLAKAWTAIDSLSVIWKSEKPLRDTACRLRADCVEKGWICHVIPIEVGCRGFIGHSVISFLSKIGITGRSLKVASNRLQNTARYASSWIWSKARKFSAWR